MEPGLEEVTWESGAQGSHCLIQGRNLHSSYSPEKEAQRWVEGLHIRCPGTLFLIGIAHPCVPSVIKKIYPEVKIFCILPSVQGLDSLSEGIFSSFGTYWTPQKNSLKTYYEDMLNLSGPEGVQLEIWPTFERLAPHTALTWAENFKTVFRQVQGSWLTWEHFGLRFWKNALRNLIHWETPFLSEKGSVPLVIAGSSPGLEDWLPWICKNKERISLGVLPSSFSVFKARRISADFGIATDAGYYAREHLRYLKGSSFPLFCGLTSAGDQTLENRPVSFFSQGDEWEKTLLEDFPLPLLTIPSQGTVAVSALQLALNITSGPVFAAGVDLAFRDLRGHAKPHTTDDHITGNFKRPQEQCLYETRQAQATIVLEKGYRTSPAMATYAGWLDQSNRFSRQVYRLAGSPLHWKSMQDISESEAQELLSTHGRKIQFSSLKKTWPQKNQRKDFLADKISFFSKSILENETSLIALGKTLATKQTRHFLLLHNRETLQELQNEILKNLQELLRYLEIKSGLL